MSTLYTTNMLFNELFFYQIKIATGDIYCTIYCLLFLIAVPVRRLRLRSQTESRYFQTQMNARRGCRAFKFTWSGNKEKRTKVWTWTHESLDMNARKVWWTHESLNMNARKVWWTHESLDMNARKVWWTHESLDMNARKVWWTHENLDMNARKVWWTHESLDMNARKILNARKSGHRHFPSGTVWTYRLSVWDLNLGILGFGFS